MKIVDDRKIRSGITTGAPVVRSEDFCETCGSHSDLQAPNGFCLACLLDTALDVNVDLQIRISIDDFELLEEVARGGMGIVYRARQRTPARVVALKMILPLHLSSANAVKRFRAEADAAASLDHENILPIYAVGEKDGAPFYIMKFAEGGSLATRLSEYKNKPNDIAKLLATLARAVEHAHQHGILHRDLKPANVLFDALGKPFVSDFGLAKLLGREANLTQTIAALGTPYYMAPEQAAGGSSLTAAADIYGLGAMFFHLLTGQPPFGGENPMEVLRNATERPAPRPRALNRHVPPDLETICLKCLEKNPASRYPSAGALADDLDRFSAGRTIRARRAGPVKHFLRWTKRNPVVAGLAAALVCLLALILLLSHPIGSGAAVQRSVAVLPFDDLSQNKTNEYLASAIHDDVLTKLSKINDLKVISRNSVMQYRGVARDTREIGRALDVNAVLEGTVQREGSRARINVQLIKAADGSQIWAENYEREISDAFAVESDVALRIAAALKANLSKVEAAGLQEVPTKNREAYLRFVEAKNLYRDYRKSQPDLDKSERLYEEAIALDSSFALAYARLSELENVYHQLYDPAPARLEKARAAAREAIRLQPNLPEAHMALGLNHWRVTLGTDDFDYDKALAEFAIAHRALPGDAELLGYIGRVERHRGNWAESTASLKKAASLDPNSVEPWHRLFFNYEVTRSYAAAEKALDHVIALAPATSRWRYECHRAHLYLRWKGELDELKRIPPPPADDSTGVHTEEMLAAKLYLHEYDAAEKIILADKREIFSWGELAGAPKPLALGRVYSFAKEHAKARVAFETARSILERSVQEKPNDPYQRMYLAETYARLGRHDDAIREADQAVAILPESKDHWAGLELQCRLAAIYVTVGDFDSALPVIQHCVDLPAGLFISDLKFDPVWEPIRNDPRFEAIVAHHPPPIRVATTSE